jgi:hypothetical protein
VVHHVFLPITLYSEAQYFYRHSKDSITKNHIQGEKKEERLLLRSIAFLTYLHRDVKFDVTTNQRCEVFLLKSSSKTFLVTGSFFVLCPVEKPY